MSPVKSSPRRTRRIGLIAASIAVAGSLALAGCASGTSTAGSSSGADGTKFTFTGLTSNQTPATTLKQLSTGACKAENSKLPISTDNADQATFDQKLQLLAGQNALPSASVSAGTPALVQQFIKAGKYVDLTKAGVADSVLPAAASTIKALYGSNDLYALPNEFNVEGIWYNKKTFADNNITVPTTWAQLVTATETLKKAGVQPITADGKDGWDVTRWVGAYLFRDLGADALKSVADGKAKLTDAEYVKAANAVSSLGKAGAFGANVASNDYNGTLNDFLTGKASMMYMGSWALTAFSDPAQNKIGSDNIGFMPFPTVAGGKGAINQIPANVGQPIVIAQKTYGAKTAAWVKCIAANYGDQVLSKSNVISGFTLKKSHDVTGLAKVVQDEITNSPSSVLWFEALMSAKQSTVSQSNGGLLGSGSMSGADFMAAVQAAS